MSPQDFKPNEPVLYIPNHAHGDPKHPDCEHGVVSSTNYKFVFVHYYRNGRLGFTAQATYPENLISKLPEYITLIDDCEKRDSRLSSWEADFLASIREQLEGKRTLSQKQIETLDAIWEKATKNG